jgi:exosortase D (VPLPA-CTERM-specific)
MHLILILLVALCFFGANWPLLEKLLAYWQSGDNSYCYFVVPLFLYLLWEYRLRFQFKEIAWSSWGVVLVLLSVGTILIGQLASVITFMFAGIWGCITGIVVMLYGARACRLVFPLLFLAFIIPLPPYLNSMLTFNLKLAASSLAVNMLRVTGVSVLQEGNIIDLGVQRLQVVDACSGLRFFIPMLLLALFMGFFFNRRWWSKTGLVLFVLPASIAFNALRLWGTGIFIKHGYHALAGGLFHDFYGWLVFMLSTGVLLIISMLFKKIERAGPAEKRTSRQDVENRSSLKLGLRPVVISMMISLLFIGNGWATKQIPNAGKVPARKGFEAFPMQIDDWQGDRHTLSSEVLASLWADDYISATFQKKGTLNKIKLLIPFYHYQATYHTAHAPQSCMLGSGWALVRSDDQTVSVLPGRIIPVRSIIWEKEGANVLSVYFFLQRGRVITSPWANKGFLLWDAVTRHRTDGALVRMEMRIGTYQGIADAQRIMDGFISDIWPVLQEYVPG